MSWKPVYKETKDKAKLASRMYGFGISVSGISKSIGIGERTIYRYLEVSGVKIRERGRDVRGRFTR